MREAVKKWLDENDSTPTVISRLFAPRQNVAIYFFPTENPKAPAKELAVKEFRLGTKGTPDYFAALKTVMNEVKVMEALKGVPNVAQLFASASISTSEGEFYCILMEHGGQSLRIYLNEQMEKLTFEERFKILVQLAQGLDGIQKAKGTHHDMKFENACIREGLVKIIDFGESIIANSTTTFKNQTISTGKKGYTIPYAAPELINGVAGIYENIDIFSFGRMAYELMHKKSEVEMNKETDAYIEIKGAAYFNTGKFQATFMSKLPGITIPDDPSPDFSYSKSLGNLFQMCVAIKPAERPVFEVVLAMLKGYKFPPVSSVILKPIAFAPSKISEVVCYNENSKKLFLVHSKIAEEGLLDITGTKTIVPLKVQFNEDSLQPATIMTSDQRFFFIGGINSKKEPLTSFWELAHPYEKIVQLKAALKEGRANASLVSAKKKVYIIGGEIHSCSFLDSCEVFNMENNTVAEFPSLSERKAEMAACIFHDQYLYVFGGGLDDFWSGPGRRMLHDYSKKIECIDLASPDKWVAITLADDKETDWGGCGKSAAIAYGDSIILFGGFMNYKEKQLYELEVGKFTFDPAAKKLGKIEKVDFLKIEYCLNGGYAMIDGVMLVCCAFPSLANVQTFYSYDPKVQEWKRQFITLPEK